ncbi:hypothetical protein L226DRAFT_571962 [Lentinus tigrinus ALCF2SS1-7]|uniref:HNH nuclease domain-containing protein n=1 Tax=Lentinus tigrinus ALCF2SS1-6 TaxID=1328759 RepID=A0A5C2RQK7_9APHY|nr:hypothetical protein L227DRAFT_616881 [Lentinus tigrinus ALCF2SS1-6]RPD73675.1 hypothetical protein L226DRAFT_571962 [Lentinus tigrinus ALCF2SS1-7]
MECRLKLDELAGERIPLYGQVAVYHPGYNCVLFLFPAYDPAPIPPLSTVHEPSAVPDSSAAPESAVAHEECTVLSEITGDPSVTGTGGVNHRLVLDACRVITNNNDGYLTTDIDGAERVLATTITLPCGIYFLHLENLSTRACYKIVANFAAWEFPESLPDHWERPLSGPERLQLRQTFGRVSPTEMSDVVKGADTKCVVSGFRLSLQTAHILPKEEHVWFNSQKMVRYCYNMSAGINDTANGVTLRSDIHLCLNRHSCVFYPCEPDDYVLYIIQWGEEDYAQLLHRRRVTMPKRVSDKFLYARFAYATFHLLSCPEYWQDLASPVPQSTVEVKAQERTGSVTRAVGLADIPEEEPPAGDTARATGDDIEMKDNTGKSPIQDGGPRTPAALHHSPQHPDTSTSIESLPELLQETEEDKKFDESWHKVFPGYPDVEDPPDTSDIQIWTYPDNPRIERLTKAYRASHPQIAMSSAGLPLHDTSPAFHFDD